jgi:hypothetical protein
MFEPTKTSIFYITTRRVFEALGLQPRGILDLLSVHLRYELKNSSRNLQHVRLRTGEVRVNLYKYVNI